MPAQGSRLSWLHRVIGLHKSFSITMTLAGFASLFSVCLLQWFLSNPEHATIEHLSACREVLYENGPDSLPRVTGLRVTKAGQEEIVEADAYVAALDVPGAKKLIPQVRGLSPAVGSDYFFP